MAEDETPDAARDTINRLLKDQGRTSAWLARELGFSYSYVTAVLRGENALTDDFKDGVAGVLSSSGPMVLEFVHGQACWIPRSVFERKVTDATFEATVEGAWKQAWVRNHGEAVLAAAADRAYRAAAELAAASR